MESLQEIITLMFGGEISVDKITTILVAVFAVVKSCTEWFSKKKLIKADKEISATDKKLADQTTQIEELKKCVGYLSDIVITAYLSSNTIDTETKKRIGNYATQVEKISNIPLSNITEDVITTITKYVPNNTLQEKEEQILNTTKKAEEIIDKVKEHADSLIDKLNI